MTTYLERANMIVEQSGIKGTRICFEQASWNSSDGNVKTYYHIHVQHDELPEFNVGVGDSSFDNLLKKVEFQIIPELRFALIGCQKIVGF